MKAVLVLALVVACSGSAAPGVSGDAGDSAGVRRGRQGATDVRAVDVTAEVDALALADVSVLVTDAAPPVVDARSVDVVSDVQPWGRIDDAGVMHCRGTPSNPVKCSQYELSTAEHWIRCWLDLTGFVKTACRWGLEGQANYDWYVLSCADCAGLEDWGAK